MGHLTKNVDEWDDANFLSDEVGDQQNDDEDMDEQIVKAKTAQTRIASGETMDDGSGHGKSAETLANSPIFIEGNRSYLAL